MTRSAPDRFLIAIVAAALALILLGLVAAAAAASRRTVVPADPATTVGVVQAYVESIRRGDLTGARAYLSRAAREELEGLRDGFRPGYVEILPDQQQRVLIEPVSEGPDQAEVRVTVSSFSARSDPFSTSTWHRQVTLRLVRENGAWRINHPADPYLLAY